MNQVITAKLKLHPDAAQFQSLRRAQLTYRHALNDVSRYAFAHGKLSHREALRRACYEEIRATYGLPAQMACNVPPAGGSDLQGAVDEGEGQHCGPGGCRTKKRYRGLHQVPKHGSPTLTYNYHRDFSLKDEQRVSVLTLD
jgi:putative transposase